MTRDAAATTTTKPGAPVPASGFNPADAERPDPALMTYYLLVAALTLVGFPFVAIAGWLKYRTLIYKFDDKGVSMAYGMFFRKEVYLTYRRIQDIHVTRNIFHRWLGLADVAVQTASGSSGAEMTIEGIRNPEALRDFLYARMRGVEDDAASLDDGSELAAAGAKGVGVLESGGGHGGGDAAPDCTTSAPGTGRGDDPGDEALALLRDIRDTLREIRSARAIAAAAPGEKPGGDA